MLQSDRVASIQAKFGGSVRQASFRKSLGSSSDPFGLNSSVSTIDASDALSSSSTSSNEVQSSSSQSQSRPYSMPALSRRAPSTAPANDDLDHMHTSPNPSSSVISDIGAPMCDVEPAPAEFSIRRAYSDPVTSNAAPTDETMPELGKMQRSLSDSDAIVSSTATELLPTSAEIDETGDTDDQNILFSQSEILALKLMFSLFDRYFYCADSH